MILYSRFDRIASHVSSAFRQALQIFFTGVHIAELLSKRELIDKERLLLYMAYLEFERTNGDPSRLQILYEDAITEFPASADLLPNYTEYLHGTLKAARMVKNIYYRATRACPCVGGLWFMGVILRYPRESG